MRFHTDHNNFLSQTEELFSQSAVITTVDATAADHHQLQRMAYAFRAVTRKLKQASERLTWVIHLAPGDAGHAAGAASYSMQAEGVH